MSAKPEAEEAVKPPKSKKMLLIILAAVLLLVLGGGGWFYLSKKNADLEDEEEEVVQVAPKGPPTFLPMDHMVVNLADPGGEKVAQVGVTLELSDVKAPERVKPYLPAIRSSVLMLVSQRTAEELLQREGKEKLAADILAEASRHFEEPAVGANGKGKKNGGKAKKGQPEEGVNPVRGVLFSSFIVQ